MRRPVEPTVKVRTNVLYILRTVFDRQAADASAVGISVCVFQKSKILNKVAHHHDYIGDSELFV